MNDQCSNTDVYLRWRTGDKNAWNEVANALKCFLKENICQYYPDLNSHEKVQMKLLCDLMFEELNVGEKLNFGNRWTFYDACAYVMRLVLVEIARSKKTDSQLQI